MEHSFDTEIAKLYGVNAAVLLKNIYFWTEKNRANGVNIHDGRAWTYNSKAAFTELFPYLTVSQIEYALKKLKDAGVIETGNFNKDPRDQTLWYAITKKGYCILENSELQSGKFRNGNGKIPGPLPDSKQADSKPDNKQKDAAALASDDIKTEFENLWKLYPNKQGKSSALDYYKKARKDKKNPVTFETVKAGIERYSAYVKATGMAKRYVKHGSTWFHQRGWEDELPSVEQQPEGKPAPQAANKDYDFDWDSFYQGGSQ